MFKKTLLALSVTAFAGAASAAIISPTVAERGTVTELLAVSAAGVGSATGTDGALLGGDDDCLLAAAALGVTADLDGNTNGTAAVAGVSDGDDAITITAVDNIDTTASSVTFTANDACTVVMSDVHSTTTTLSPTEAPAGSVSIAAVITVGAADLTVDSVITINVSGASFDTTEDAPTLTDQAAAATFDLFDYQAGFVKYKVSGAAAGARSHLDLAAAVLDSTGLSAETTVELDFKATDNAIDYDVTADVTVHGFTPQYSAVVEQALNGVIDVSQDREALLAGAAADVITDAANFDTLRIDMDLDATANPVTPDDITFVITGEWSWLSAAADANEDGTTSAAELTTYLGSYMVIDGGGAQAPTSQTLSADLTTLTIVDTTGGTVGGDYDFAFPVPGTNEDNSQVLTAQEYTVTATVTDALATPTSMVALTDAAAGEWTLNGSVITIPYMPFDDNVTVILRHTNSGVQTGDLSVRYMLEGVDTEWQSVGIVASSTRGVMNIRDAVLDAITADSGVTAGKVAIEITTNIPADDALFYAAYKVKDEQDRGFVGTFGGQ